VLIINADDWGWDRATTDRSLDCFGQGRISTISAMVFMQDSERAAELAIENGLDVGLHLNFTQGLSGETVPSKFREQHISIASYLKARKFNQVLFNPFLRRSFDYVFLAQWDEFTRLYRKEPSRLDGHHHMHLCMNMLFLNKYPKGMKVRRSFTFTSGEKGPINRLYRFIVDGWLTSRFQCTDLFFSLKPIEPERIRRIVLLSKTAEVELMVHPGVDKEYQYLLSEDWLKLILSVRL